uniref:Uncharacterized protein n=1 Tax=viral metagenome TaxID=1070528 RepID=A0A6H1ZHQ2_9ZZZZ
MNKKIEAIVRSLLEHDERTRNDDRLLWVKTIWQFDETAFLKDQDGKYLLFVDRLLKDLPMENTTKRIRAKIQNVENKFIPTDPEVLKKRSNSKRDLETYRDWENNYSE